MIVKLIFRRVLDSVDFGYEITLESVPGTNQYNTIRVTFLAWVNNT